MILFSAFCFAAAVWRNLYHAEPPVPTAKRLRPALLLTVNGFLVLVSFAAPRRKYDAAPLARCAAMA